MKWLSVIRRRKRFCTDLTSSSIGALVRVGPEPTTLLILSVFTFFFFFSQKSAMGKLPSLQPLRGPLSARSVVCKEGNIWMRSCVRAVRKSVSARFSLLVFLTFSVFHFLTCSLAHFSVSHFLISSLFTSSLAEFLTFSISELSANRGKWVVGRLRNEANTKAHIKKVCHRDAALKFNILLFWSTDTWPVVQNNNVKFARSRKFVSNV